MQKQIEGSNPWKIIRISLTYIKKIIKLKEREHNQYPRIENDKEDVKEDKENSGRIRMRRDRQKVKLKLIFIREVTVDVIVGSQDLSLYPSVVNVMNSLAMLYYYRSCHIFQTRENVIICFYKDTHTQTHTNPWHVRQCESIYKFIKYSWILWQNYLNENTQ